MNKLEQLMLEYDDLIFEHRNDMPEHITGLILGSTVYLNNKLNNKELTATIAEEIGHYETTPEINIADYSLSRNRKYESIARRWSYKKLIPLHKLKKYKRSKEQIMKYDISEELDLPEDIVEKAFNMYKIEGKI